MQRVDQSIRSGGDLIDGLIEGGFVYARWFRRPAQLSHELKR